MTAPSDLSNEQLLNLLSGSGSPVNADPSLPRPPIQESALPPIGGKDDQWLLAAIANAGPRMPAYEDVGRSLTSGVEQGITGQAGARGSAQDYIGSHAKEFGAAVEKATGFPHLADAADFVSQALKQGGQAVDNLHIPLLPQFNPPTTSQIDKSVQAGLGPYHDPQTEAGTYARTIGQFAPAAAMGGGSVGPRLAQVIAPAMLSEAAGQMAHGAGPGWETAARAAGGIVGGLGVGGVQAMIRAPDAAVGTAIPTLTEAQMQAVQTLRQSAQARGLSISLPEAVQQVTNNGTGLGRMQRVIEGTKEGQARTAPYFANRPAQVRDAVTQFADTISPPTTQPGMVAQQAEEAGTEALHRARQVVNNAAGLDYAALPGQTMDPAQYNALSANPSYRVALEALRAHPELGAAVAHLPDNNMAVINEVVKRLRTGADQAAGTPLMPGDNHLASLRTGGAQLADAVARGASSEYGSARDTVSDLSRQYVDPLKAGPVGTISQPGPMETKTGALYPMNPAEGASHETGAAIRVLNGVDPGIADALTRQHVMNTLNTAGRDLRGGQSQYVGDRLANMIAGNREQEATLHAGVSALPEGGSKSADLTDLLDALRATGKRQAAGSMTSFNNEDIKNLQLSPTIRAMESFDIAKPFEFIGNGLKGMNYRRNVHALADMIMADPDRTAEILRRARAAAPGGGIPGAALVAPVTAGHRP